MADDFIIIESYNSDWPVLAKQEVARLKGLLPFPWIEKIEHIGSTAIPDIPAKPVLDLAIGVTDLELAKAIIPILEKQSYVFWAENPDKTKLFLVKGMPPFGEKRTHHIHVMKTCHHDWVVRPLFRDHLIAHPEIKQAYADLKQELALKFREDREAYTEAKTQFIRSVNQKAIKPHLKFARLTAEDLPLLKFWLDESHVKTWWDQNMIKYILRLAADSPIKCFIIKIDNVPVGFIQHYPSGYQAGAEGVDFFIGNPTFIGKGLGAFLLSEFIERMLPAKTVVVDPDVKNVRAIRTYEKTGFQKIAERGNVMWMLRKKT